MLLRQCLPSRHAHTNTHMHTSMHIYLHPCTCSLGGPLYRPPLPGTHDSGPYDLKPWCPWIQASPTVTLFKMYTSSSQASCIFPFCFFLSVVLSGDLHPSIFALVMSHSVLLHVVLSWAEDPCSKQTEGPDIGPGTEPLLSDMHRQCCYDLEEEGEAWAGSETPLGFCKVSLNHQTPGTTNQLVKPKFCILASVSLGRKCSAAMRVTGSGL